MSSDSEIVGVSAPEQVAQEGSETSEPSAADATVKSASVVEPKANSIVPKSPKEEIKVAPTKTENRYYAPADEDLDDIDFANPPKPPGDVPRGPLAKPTARVKSTSQALKNPPTAPPKAPNPPPKAPDPPSQAPPGASKNPGKSSNKGSK